MRKIIALLTTTLLMGWSINGWSFTCVTSEGAVIPSHGGSANVNVTLAPEIQVGQNLVVDLSNQISCRNDAPQTYIDYVSLQSGSAFGGVLANFRGSVRYNGGSYPFPTNSETPSRTYTSPNYVSWPVTLFLTPISSAAGVAISAGSRFATLVLHQTNNFGESWQYIWNIYARNNVVVPTGGCDVSARNVTVTLPDYPGSVAVPVSVYCAQNQRLSYYLTGTTFGGDNSVFVNTASGSPAQGIGVQMRRNGTAIRANNNVSLGTVGSSAVNLGLTATYARTSGQVTAGNVQSIIGVTFTYQ